MRLFDTHFHFTGEATPPEFMNAVRSDCALALDKLGISGTEVKLHLAAVGGDYVESLRAAEFSTVVPDCCFAAGVHPHQAAEYLADRRDFSIFRSRRGLKAVGELGLDYFYEFSDRDAQRRVFQEFLGLALEWKLPAIVHLRDREGMEDAYRDGLALLEPFSASGGRFVVHCYAGSREFLKRFLELGAYIGATGMVTFKAAGNIREVLAEVPAERLLIETDSPYLAPVPFRGRENTPGLLVLALAAAARVRGVTCAELAELTFRNALDFYRLDGGGL